MGLFRRRFSLVVGTAFVVLTVLGFNYAPIPGNLSGPMAHLQHLQQAQAQGGRMRPIVLGQTEGFARGELVVFDYTENFMCASTPNPTLGPLNIAKCKVGVQTPLVTTQVNLDPDKVLDIIVIVPLFDSTADANNHPEFLEGATGLSALGSDTFVQCPETQSSGLAGGSTFGAFGHCIFHDTFLDVSPVAGLVGGVVVPGTGAPFCATPTASSLGAGCTLGQILTALGGLDLAGFEDDPAILDIPLPNHTHLVEATPGGSVPWDIKVVLVRDQAKWPNANGMCTGPAAFCLNSFDAINAVVALQGGILGPFIIGPVPSTLFLFFGVHGLNP